jgi:riboflavin kinase/FMN adenylyltransferase
MRPGCRYLCGAFLMTSDLRGDTPQSGLHDPVLTIGTFDGVHLGHHAILNEVKRHAEQIGGESVVITFEPHPRQVLQPEAHIQILTPLAEKLELLKRAGIQHVSVTPFTKEFAQLSAEAYVEEFLIAQYKPAAIVIGYDHKFGHDRCGDISLLEKYSEQGGFSVYEIPAHMIADATISSTKIRTALRSGDVSTASQMLGRDYSIRGSVVHGEKLGRKLGYPTANILPSDSAQLIPGHGIYAVRVSMDGALYPAMLSIGTRPTVSDAGNVSIEAYLFDFNGDIYEKEVSVLFVEWMRAELKFGALEELIEALKKDEVEARRILGV